jgi:anti-sigma factor NepR-like protein
MSKPVTQMAQMQSSDIDKKKSTKTSRLDRGTRAKLGQQLRAMYDEVVSQGVPSRFAELLNGLDNEGKQNAH